MEYRSVKRILHSAIKKSRAGCWQELLDEVDGDPLEFNYNLFTRIIAVVQRPCLLNTKSMDRNVQALFLIPPVRVDLNPAASPGEF